MSERALERCSCGATYDGPTMWLKDFRKEHQHDARYTPLVEAAREVWDTVPAVCACSCTRCGDCSDGKDGATVREHAAALNKLHDHLAALEESDG